MENLTDTLNFNFSVSKKRVRLYTLKGMRGLSEYVKALYNHMSIKIY